jgi:hypothetical protein
MPTPIHFLRRLMQPLRSRKTRVVLATAAAAFAAERGWNVSSELVLGIIGIGASLVLGIAHEDAGRHAASHRNQPAPETGAEKIGASS